MPIKEYASILHQIKNSVNFNKGKRLSFQRPRIFIRSSLDANQNRVYLGMWEVG